MKSQGFRVYLFFLAPAFIIPIAIYLFDENVSLIAILRAGFLFPVMMLSLKGLTTFFPQENLRERSVGRMIEYAIWQGVVFAGCMVLFTGFTQPDLQPSLIAVLRQFAIGMLAISISSFMTAKSTQTKLRAS